MVIIINIIFQVYLQYRTKYIASVFFAAQPQTGRVLETVLAATREKNISPV